MRVLMLVLSVDRVSFENTCTMFNQQRLTGNITINRSTTILVVGSRVRKLKTTRNKMLLLCSQVEHVVKI